MDHKLQFDLKYFQRCLDLGLYPPFLRFKPPKLRAYDDVNKVLNQVVINQIKTVKDEQRCEEKKLRNLISTIGLQLTYIEKVSLILLLKKANEKAALEIVKRHEKKLYNLWRASRPRTPDSLMNLSSRKLTLEEENKSDSV